jgi:hypothetical protein
MFMFYSTGPKESASVLNTALILAMKRGLMRFKQGLLKRYIGLMAGSRRYGNSLGQDRLDNTLIGSRSSSGRSSRLVTLWAIVILLAACVVEYGFILTIENHTDQEVIVRAVLYDFQVAPCSVEGYAPLTRGRKMPVVRVTDDQGVELSNFEVHEGASVGGLPYLQVKVGLENSVCPPAVRGQYMVTITNQAKQEIEIWSREDRLGTLDYMATEVFGPFEGPWTDARDIEIRDSQGNNLLDGRLLRSWHLEYELGHVPMVLFTVQPGWK